MKTKYAYKLSLIDVITYHNHIISLSLFLNSAHKIRLVTIASFETAHMSGYLCECRSGQRHLRHCAVGGCAHCACKYRSIIDGWSVSSRRLFKCADSIDLWQLATQLGMVLTHILSPMVNIWSHTRALMCSFKDMYSRCLWIILNTKFYCSVLRTLFYSFQVPTLWRLEDLKYLQHTLHHLMAATRSLSLPPLIRRWRNSDNRIW